jgi:hypothetical protein
MSKLNPCKIVLSQSYDYLFELLPMVKMECWFWFNDVITTSVKQAQYLSTLFPFTNIVPVSIPSYLNLKRNLNYQSLLFRNQGDKEIGCFIYNTQSINGLRLRVKRTYKRTVCRWVRKACLAVRLIWFWNFPIRYWVLLIIGNTNMIPEWMESVDSEGNV